MVNNSQARLDLFLRRREPVPPKQKTGDPQPNVVLDDHFFERKEILTEKSVSALAAGDLDGDGRADLVWYGKPAELVVAFGDGGGGFGRTRTFDIRDGSVSGGALEIGDLNGDDRNDLAFLLGTDTAVFYQGDDGTLQEPVKFPHAVKAPRGVGIHDLDGDGRQDLVQLAPAEARPVRTRFQQPDGTLGPEVAFKLARLSVLDLLDLDGRPGDEVLVVQRTSGLLRALTMSRQPAGKETGIPLGSVQIHPFEPKGSDKGRAVAVGDVDADGRNDVIVTEPSLAQVAVHLQTADGKLSGRRLFPSLSQASAVRIADLDGDGRNEVVVLSSTEKVVGSSTFDGQGRLSFPTPLPVAGTPRVLETGDLDGDGRVEAIVVTEIQKKPHVVVVRREEQGFEAAQPWELKGAKGTPAALMLLDLNQDGRPDLLTFDKYDRMRTWTRDPSGSFADVSEAPGYRAGLVDKLAPNAVNAADLDGDGKQELLVASGNFARSIVLDAAGGLVVREQMNGRAPDSKIKCAAALDVTGDGKVEVALLDEQGKVVSILRRNPSGAFEVAASFPLGGFALQHLTAADLNGDGRRDLLVIGRKRFGVLYSGGRNFELEELHSFESPIRDARLGVFDVGDLNGNRVPDIAVSDVRNGMIEIVSYRAGEGFRHETKWRVFEEKLHRGRRRGRPEPREIVVTDLDADGKDDLAILVHDRLIVYPQE
ncbi:MAG: FG-GAP repeat domain-containing protein [Planctomycetota bacterium]